ncbi:hypothetical protein OT109_05880 [Phycisphaeraceae bacterium D3-23]
MLFVVLVWGAACNALLHTTGGSPEGGGGYLDWLTKSRLETTSVVMLGVALAAILGRWFAAKEASKLWLAAVVVVLFCRELHFAGTSEAVYVGIALLLVVALYRPRWTQDILTSRSGATLLAMAFACYAFSVSLDGKWWFDWTVRWVEAAKLAEEVLEFTGHTLILALACTAPVISHTDDAPVDHTAE